MTNDDIVKFIPGNCKNNINPIALDVTSFAGYAGTPFHEKTAELFYWFFESRSSAPVESTPLIIWLNGGPGAPSTLGLFLENGPYGIKEDAEGTVIVNDAGWNEKAHLLYWDQPVGTGYSCVSGEHPEETFVTNEDELSDIFHGALQDFLTRHPRYRSCPLYITGESYGGKYIPNIALKIDEKNEAASSDNKINLKGIAVGDGWIDPGLQMKVYIDYAFTMGYLDTCERLRQMESFEKFRNALDRRVWKEAYTISNDIVADVSALGGNFDVYNISRFSEISMANVQSYMENETVKRALHVPQSQPWICADNKGPVAENLIEDNMSDTSSLYGRIIEKTEKYRVLMYTGTFDTACGSLSTEKILYDLKKWNDDEENNKWKSVERFIWGKTEDTPPKGFIKRMHNLTQIVIPGSGHQVPYYKPYISREMINTWMFEEPFTGCWLKLSRDVKRSDAKQV